MNTRRMNRSVRLLLTSCLILTMMLTVTGPARAASFVVTNLNDSGTGSLRQAISDADAAAGADTITFGVSGTILLSSTLPSIHSAAGLTIDGSGQSIIISGNDAVRVLLVTSGTALTLRNLSITGGNASLSNGGAISNNGTLTVTDSTFSGNSADIGGAISNGGLLTVTGSTFSDNSAQFGGGGIANDGTLNVSDSTFSGNTAVGAGGMGGAILNYANLTVTGSTFSGNTSIHDAGGIDNYGGTLQVTDSTFSGNTASHWGGGILSYGDSGTLDVSNSTFSDNSASIGGGILSFFHATLTVTDSVFLGNIAQSGGGGIVNFGGTLDVTDTTFSENKGGAISNQGPLTVTHSTFSENEGGGISNTDNMTVTDSTFSGNTASIGGGIFNAGTGQVTDSTIVGNSADNAGGICNCGVGSTMSMTNSTLSGNTAGNTGGGILNYANLTATNSTLSGNSARLGGGIYNHSIATLRNTLVADSADANCFNDGSLIDGGGNLSWPDTTCPGLNADPLLAPLQENGGPTQTQALLPGSPAIDAALLKNCPTTDQRGISRPQGAGCDIGAYESVIYNFSGFFQPVDNLPTFNVVQAGVGIPVRFSLNGDQGLNIFAAGYPISQQIVCKSGAPQDAIEETVIVGSSSLSYDAASATYTYLWKTSKAWPGTCRQLNLKLNDGTEHKASFKFVK